MIKLTVYDSSEVSHARQAVSRLADGAALSEKDVARAALVVTECATNLLKHGNGGEILAGLLRDHEKVGMQILALDKGPGMENLRECLKDGYSTAGSSGTGLGAIQRTCDVFDIYSEPGKGTVLLSQVWEGKRAPEEGPFEIGAINLPMPGEEECGDAWTYRIEEGVLCLLVADGLGHGPLAASASRAAVHAFCGVSETEPGRLIADCHDALSGTRGAAVAIAKVTAEKGVTYCGVGNIAGVLLSPTKRRSMVSFEGIVGHQARKIQEFQYDWAGDTVMVMHSDGLSSSWSLAGYRGLFQRHPAVIAGLLYRDFNRGRDDVTVVAVRDTAS